MAYSKQAWRDYDDTKTENQNRDRGAVVTPERLNHMETGIANSAERAELEQTKQDITSQLAQKANQTDVNAQIGRLAEAKPLFADDVTKMTDTTRLYVNLEDGYLYNYAGGSWINTNVLYQSMGIAPKTVFTKHLDDTLASDFKGIHAELTASGQYRNVMSKLDVKNIPIKDTPIKFTFDYYIPNNTKTTTFMPFLWAESSGQSRLSDQSPNSPVEIGKITTVEHTYQFAEERDMLTFFVRFNVPSVVPDEYYLRNAKATINDVVYPLSVWEVFSSEGTIKNVENLPTRLVSESALSKYEIKDESLKDKTVMTFGDSVTWYDGQKFVPTHTEAGQNAKGYQSYLKEEFGVTIINKGGSGYRLADNILPLIKSADYTGVSIVTITSGANDFRNVKAVGSLSPIGSAFDESTFYGALQSGVEHILSVNPEIKVILITPIPGWDDVRGKMPVAYPNAIKDVAKTYGLPCCDWYYESGINDITKNVYIGDAGDTTYDLHPTNAGFENMGRMLVATFKSH